MIKKFVIYHKINPFPGYIEMWGKMDLQKGPDGTTKKEMLDSLGNNRGYFLTDISELFPDREIVKYDFAQNQLVSLDQGDITPLQELKNKKNQKQQDIATNLPSWIQVRNKLNSIKSDIASATSLAQLKPALIQLLNFEEKQARIVYWLAKNQKD